MQPAARRTDRCQVEFCSVPSTATRRITEVRLVRPLLTLPISEVHDTTMVLGTVVDSRMREVILMGRLGLFGSTPFFVGGRYPCQSKTKPICDFLVS